MRSLRELLLLIRYGQARASVAYHLHDIERAKAGLLKAYNAYDKASADLRMLDGPTRDSDPPRFLLSKKP